MNYHNITKDDMLNGDGLRVVLWVSGCNHHCKNCHNTITWDAKEGLLFDESAEQELFEQLQQQYISGITLSGGDPLFPDNRKEITTLVNKIKKYFCQKTIWCYTGYLWEEVKQLEVMKNIDVLVDGKFIEELADPQLHWKGSSNQRVIDVQQSLKQQKVILKC
ncbi:anaerobic ribonucleoside-triphosphate reductase activating protein [Clostridium sp. MD294]|nr:anaerobic ribonucleoside-triphosphate reductase activating protein [Clostridium sp. MD294]NDO46616.1 anaerobic ribonucleoside-triphosphate reductase activating protein [Clostridium sp. MD294]USF28951.1 Anaerobic ribonucleoside-triphosphate reductase-activating protein [Clostridium sp. MD294]